MDFTTLFALFWTKFRGDNTPPGTTDPEWKIAIRNYNSALDRLENFDDTKWDFLKTRLKLSTQVSPVLDYTLNTGDTFFVAPTDMLYPGPLYWKTGTTGVQYPPIKVYKPEDVGSLNQYSQWGYFLGDKNSGFTFYINPTVPSNENGFTLDYMYYKKATRLNADTEVGTTIVIGADSEFLAGYMAAQRFLDSRNFPAYQVMKRDSEESLKGMKLRNNSGDTYNAPLITDTGPGFGV